MGFQNQFIFVTLAMLVSQSYSLPEFSESVMADIEKARIVQRGVLDCNANHCWSDIGELPVCFVCYSKLKIKFSFFNSDVRDQKCPNKEDRYVTKRYLTCFCCRVSQEPVR